MGRPEAVDDSDPEMTREELEKRIRAMANDEMELVTRTETLPGGRTRQHTTWERKDRPDHPDHQSPL